MTGFWDVALCSLTEIDRHFGEAYRPDNGGSKDVCQFLRDYTTQEPRR